MRGRGFVGRGYVPDGPCRINPHRFVDVFELGSQIGNTSNSDVLLRVFVVFEFGGGLAGAAAAFFFADVRALAGGGDAAADAGFG